MPHLYVTNRSTQAHDIYYNDSGVGYRRTIAPGTQQCLITDGQAMDIDGLVSHYAAYGATKADEDRAGFLVFSGERLNDAPLVDQVPFPYRPAPQVDAYDEIAASLTRRHSEGD